MSVSNSLSPFHVFLRRLTNLSGNSRMLFISRLSEGKHIDFQRFSFLNSKNTEAPQSIKAVDGLHPNSFSAIEKLLQGKQVSICPLVDPRVPSANELSKSLKALHRAAAFLFEEGGTKDLHIGWPFVRGKFLDGTWVQCPLVLLPVDLIASEKEWRLVPRDGAAISFNKSFLLALSFYNKTPLAESLLEEDFEEVERDSTVFRTALYSMLQKEKLEINFNPNTYQDALESFSALTKDEFEQGYVPGQLKLFPQAVLGIFPQADSYLVPDYVKLIESSLNRDVAEFFHSKSVPLPEVGKKNFVGEVSEEKLLTPFAADSFQENILKAVKLGHSVVVQGPPGTGKSQLICNLLADALANKKNVLVVCQKRAALDVVWHRMAKAGFADFVALVHDFKNDRRKIYSQIAIQVDKVVEYKTRVNGLDAIQLERNFVHAGKRVEQITEELEEFRRALFDTTECGVSIKELYLNTNPHAPLPVNLRQEFSQFRMDDLAGVLSKIKSLGTYLSILEKDGKPWRDRKPFVKIPPSALSDIVQTIDEIVFGMHKLSERTKETTGSTLDFQQADIFSNRLEDLKLLRSVLLDEKVYQALNPMVQERTGETDTLWVQNIQRVVEAIFDGDGPEVSVGASELGKFQQVLHKGVRARANIITFFRWQLFSKDKYLIDHALEANKLSGREGLKKLERMLDIRLNLEHNLSKLRSKPWIKNIPDSYSRQDFDSWFGRLVLATRCNNLFDEIRNLKNFLSPHRIGHGQFLKVMDELIAMTEEFLMFKSKWSVYLSDRQIEEVGTNFSHAAILKQYLHQHFDTMCEFDDMLDSLSSVEKNIFQKLNAATDYQATGDELCDIFSNSLGLNWIDQIEAKWPELRMVSSGKLEQLERELRENIAIKTRLSEEMVLLRARERITEELQYNRLNNLTTYRDLHHEVTKKKRIWPLRKLIGTFHEELFRVMPIWLASPESVSALFPMDEYFDLVIFDEASQCFAERGIPAMARARQIVVAGDQQQLKPGDFFQSRWDEEIGDADTEVESLLDLSSRHLLSLPLQGHYRSQSPELVEFSNRNFYQNRLELLPHRDKVNSPEPAIDFVKVEGVWENQTNEVEAMKVGELVFDLSQRYPEKEIGVITFNQLQQMLVMDKVEEKFDVERTPVPKSLMIKNIENVQGDEKDIIIFSIGYAPDARGKMSAQFGSLNVAGGENRLNVAITRAREKVMVVCSVWPDNLHTDDTKNIGPKLLKEYLQFAHSVSERRDLPGHSKPSKQLHWYLKYRLPLKQSNVLFDFFPNADIVVKNEKGFGSLILTDDNFYQQALSAKHHHALLPKLLEGKNWEFRSVYSRNFWRDREKFVKEIERMYS
jgi:AAA domain/Protein of unknown function (DUF4011)